MLEVLASARRLDDAVERDELVTTILPMGSLLFR